MAATKSADSGMLRFDGSHVTYASRGYGSFSVALSDLAVIGEFTTDQGPFIDDWFLVFVRRDVDRWYEASMYAEGIQAVFEQLSAQLRSPLFNSLAAITDYDSRILWPPPFAGCPLFTFGPAKNANPLRRIKLSLLPEVTYALSAEALSAMGKTSLAPEAR